MKLARALVVLAFCLPAQAFACGMFYEADADLVAMMEGIDEAELAAAPKLEPSEEGAADLVAEVIGVAPVGLAMFGSSGSQLVLEEGVNEAGLEPGIADAEPSTPILPEG